MSVLATLRARHPEMVIDNRLSAHAYGPWQTISGSYSEPIAGDENPETYGIPVSAHVLLVRAISSIAQIIWIFPVVLMKLMYWRLCAGVLICLAISEDLYN